MSGDGVDRWPGGWVPGIGWVALLTQVHGASFCRVKTYGDGAAVIVTRWPDGSTPEAPVVQETECAVCEETVLFVRHDADAALAVIPEAPAATPAPDDTAVVRRVAHALWGLGVLTGADYGMVETCARVAIGAYRAAPTSAPPEADSAAEAQGDPFRHLAGRWPFENVKFEVWVLGDAVAPVHWSATTERGDHPGVDTYGDAATLADAIAAVDAVATAAPTPGEGEAHA